jgi:predicted Zn-dependent protease
MGRRAGANESQIPAIVRSHPITSDRIAESKSRAVQYPAVKVTDSLGFALMRERVRVLTTPAGENPANFYKASVNSDQPATPVRLYGNAIALLAADNPEQAIPLLKKLRDSDDRVTQYHTALGQAYSYSGDNEQALAVFDQAMHLFPRNVPITVRYADALVRANQPRRAHEVLLDLFNSVAPTPEQARQIALAANAAGDVSDAYHYMAEFHLMSGDLALAANQLQMALAVPKITDVQRARYRARLDEIRAAMPRKMRMQASDSSQRRPQ